MIQISLKRWVKYRLVVYQWLSHGFRLVEQGWPRTRTSHPLSALVRPILEGRKWRAMVGANLAAAVVVVGTVGTPAEAINQFPEVEVATLAADSVVVTTEGTFQLPVGGGDVSQGFNRFHRGVDLRAPLRTPVYPVSQGRVSKITNGRWGYGRWVTVEHEGEVSSLYAHLGRIKVEEGQGVDKGTELGEVGLTGWTTGPHLHLEIYEHGQAINPRQVLPL